MYISEAISREKKGKKDKPEKRSKGLSGVRPEWKLQFSDLNIEMF